MRMRFVTPSGLAVDRTRAPLDYDTALDGLARRLDRAKGAIDIVGRPKAHVPALSEILDA